MNNLLLTIYVAACVIFIVSAQEEARHKKELITLTKKSIILTEKLIEIKQAKCEDL